MDQDINLLLQKGREYKFENGIYKFIDEKQLKGSDKKFNKMYNRIAWIYYWLISNYIHKKFGSEEKFRMQFLNELEIKAGDKVLEICVGCGDNLRYLPKDAHYYGADFSSKMLNKALKYGKEWELDLTLALCHGEDLPFADNTFDAVLHSGGINFFKDKKKAISEMIRVSKPGRKLVLVDETDAAVQKGYRKSPLVSGEFRDASGMADLPLDLIPKEMLDVRAEIVSYGVMYKIMFHKPMEEADIKEAV